MRPPPREEGRIIIFVYYDMTVAHQYSTKNETLHRHNIAHSSNNQYTINQSFICIRTMVHIKEEKNIEIIKRRNKSNKSNSTQYRLEDSIAKKNTYTKTHADVYISKS